MDKQGQVVKPMYSILPIEVKGFDSLAKLALDMRCSWNHAADEVWQQLDPDLWNLTHNPWVVLQTVSRDKFQNVMSDSNFRKKVDSLLQSQGHANTVPAWFQQNYPNTSLTSIAYFSMEFML